MAKQRYSKKNNPTPAALSEDLESVLLDLEDKTKEVTFLRNELTKASTTITELSKALNQKQIASKEYPPLTFQPPKFFNSKSKQFEPASKDELAQFNEDMQDILGVSVGNIEGES